MKYKQKGNETLYFSGMTITATDGVFNVDNEALIQAMEINGYEAGETVPETADENQTILHGAPVTYPLKVVGAEELPAFREIEKGMTVEEWYAKEADDGRETEQGDKEGQEIEAELSYAELKRKAKDADIKGYQKMKKADLIEALEG